MFQSSLETIESPNEGLVRIGNTDAGGGMEKSDAKEGGVRAATEVVNFQKVKQLSRAAENPAGAWCSDTDAVLRQ